MKVRAMLGALALTVAVLLAPSVTEAGDRYSRHDGRRSSDRGYYRGHSYRGNSHRGDYYRGNSYRGNSHRGYSYRGGRSYYYGYSAPRYHRYYRPYYPSGYGYGYAPPAYGYYPYYDPYYYAPGFCARPGFSFFLGF